MGRTIREGSCSRGNGGVSITHTGPRTPEATMTRHGNLAIGMVILLGVLLLAAPGVVVAGESTWTDWKKNLPFDLTGEIEAGGQIVQPRGSGTSSTFDEY